MVPLFLAHPVDVNWL